MADAINREVYDQLSVPEKIRLVQEIWDDIAKQPEAVAIAPEAVEEAERRARQHHADPSGAVRLEDALRGIRAGR